jgi:hypothetical protein
LQREVSASCLPATRWDRVRPCLARVLVEVERRRVVEVLLPVARGRGQVYSGGDGV